MKLKMLRNKKGQLEIILIILLIAFVIFVLGRALGWW